MSTHNGDRVPWADQLKKLHAGVPHKAEWMAPDEVVNQVRGDYRRALDWQHDSVLTSIAHQWREAAQYFSGQYLKQYRATLYHQRHAKMPVTVGVLRADHRIEVRRFSEHGERCLVVDYQTQRRMATYDYETRARLHTQDMGNSAIVCQMLYDNEWRRWKLDKTIQRLPSGWMDSAVIRHIEVLADLPSAPGRDH